MLPVWAQRSPESPPCRWRRGCGGLPRVAAAIGERAQALGIAVQMDEETVRLFVQLPVVFDGNTRELMPVFVGFLVRAAMLVRDVPGSREIIAGFADHPAARNNPVQPGLRDRRVRTQLATWGVPLGQIKAAVMGREHYVGSDESSGLAPAESSSNCASISVDLICPRAGRYPGPSTRIFRTPARMNPNVPYGESISRRRSSPGAPTYLS